MAIGVGSANGWNVTGCIAHNEDVSQAPSGLISTGRRIWIGNDEIDKVQPFILRISLTVAYQRAV